MMPCLARCRTGRHTCVMAHGHHGAHAAPGHIWDTPSPPWERVMVFRAALTGSGYSAPWAVRIPGVRESYFRTHAAALAHALAAVGLATAPEHREGP